MISSPELLERARIDLHGAHDLAQVRWVMEKIAQAASLRHAVYHLPGVPGSPAADGVTLWSYPQDWVNRYLKENYRFIDPVVSLPQRTILPTDWSDLARNSRTVRTMFGEAEEHGVGPHGLTIPLRGLYGETALISFTCDEDLSSWREIKRRTLPGLQSAALLVHQRVLELTPAATAQSGPRLSPRERECLELLANGMRSKQIARAFGGISHLSVDEYIDSARRKLGAPTRTCAAARGVWLKIISPNR